MSECCVVCVFCCFLAAYTPKVPTPVNQNQGNVRMLQRKGGGSFGLCVGKAAQEKREHNCCPSSICLDPSATLDCLAWRGFGNDALLGLRACIDEECCSINTQGTMV